MSKLLQSIKRSDIYQRSKASWIYDAYWIIAKKPYVEDRRQEIAFYHRLLAGFRNGDLIFDIGANEGYKTGIFLKLGARVISIEPDETCQHLLNQQFIKYRLLKKPIVIVPKAVSDKRSVEKMWVNRPGSAINTLSQKWADVLTNDHQRFGASLQFGKCKDVETVPIDELIAEYGAPFFIKIDVEGHELSVLRGLRQPVPYLSFEVNLPEFRREGIECIRCLESLDPSGVFNFSADCRKGLEFSEWLSAEACSTALRSCAESSIEVFWKTV